MNWTDYAYSLCNGAYEKITRASYFPVLTGYLRDYATYVRYEGNNSFSIVFQGAFAPYVVCLEEGTTPHDIPNAFGMGETFGIGGRFDGKFHPGSKIHQGFISRDAYTDAINYISSRCHRKFNVIKEGFGG